MSESRVGLGYDTHRFSAVRTLVLGGVEIPDTPGLHGFSDADVVAHAVIDAVLGAAALGDLGRHFPDTDPSHEGANSIGLLREAVARAREEGWRVVNVDATVVCEEPKIAPYSDQMAERLAQALGIDRADVGVKGTSNEGMGFVGRGEGIAAIAVAMLERDR
jgi:2-C-methyl-D-erythritol 2,4-cyclodiphosphate synthase